MPSPNPNPSPSPNPNHSAHLMALLAPSPLESATSTPAPSSIAASSTHEPPAIIHATPSAPPLSRLPSSKIPRGRHLGAGDRVVYDVDSRLPGEAPPPQLEVSPITKYTSDPCLVLGRQIAVNRSYICYGLKQGSIRVLNIGTAMRALLRDHTQRVTDMAFFAEDVHLLASASVDGKIYVRKIDEGPDEENKPQITGKITVAVQLVGDRDSYHPRICWHSHKQEILFVGFGNNVLKLDMTKVGRGKKFSAEEPLKCSIEKLIDGIQFIGKHEGDVTDLSISQWMTTRLVSSSKDGTVKIWDERRAMPLATLKPHEGQPVNSVEFLASPHRPDHIVLITAGLLNKEIKIWTSSNEEGWLFPSDSELWICTQTLELRSSAESRAEEVFFNQVVVLPQASLILIANAKKNAIYAVHVDYGSCPTSTRMDYISDFTVAMPILSLTGISDGEQVVQVYCVQTQAIQQYALDLAQCLPPPNDNVLLGKDSFGSGGFDSPSSKGFNVLEPSRGSNTSGSITSISSPKPTLTSNSPESVPAAIRPATSVSSDIGDNELTLLNAEPKPGAPISSVDADIEHSACPSSQNLDLSERISAMKSPSIGFERECDADQSYIDHSTNKSVSTITSSGPDFPSINEFSGKVESKTLNAISMVPDTHLMFTVGGNTAHLVTPSEILTRGKSSSESTLVNQGMECEKEKIQEVFSDIETRTAEMEVKVVGESKTDQNEKFDIEKQAQTIPAERKEETISSQASGSKYDMARECCVSTTESSNVEGTCPINHVDVAESLEQLSGAGKKEVRENTKDMPINAPDSTGTAVLQSVSAAKVKKPIVLKPDASGQTSASLSPPNFNDSSNEQGSSAGPPTEAAFSQILDMQEMLNQLVNMQKEMQKQISVVVAAPITKEGKRVETALGRNMEKVVKANIDALWARFQEENLKREKAEREHIQQITSLITNTMSKDLPAIMERTLKKEISAVGPSLARAITPVIEKTISSAIADSFQRGVGDKAVNQLEKSVNSKLEATIARQIQAQFQTSGKQSLQDALRSSLESSVIPAFELSCKSMFEQVDTVLQKGLIEFRSSAQQQFESTNTPLAITLRDSIKSASSITQSITTELADGQRKILALLTAGNSTSSNPAAMQQSNGPMAGRPEMVDAPLDPTKELARLISERKYDEAFTLALQRSDVSIVSWLCSQVDLQGICSMVPIPLSQGVLLALLQQLACDISNDMPRKLEWMTSVAVVINPTDPMITLHIRPILEQVYNVLAHQRSTPTTSATKVRALMHVINSVLLSCK